MKNILTYAIATLGLAAITSSAEIIYIQQFDAYINPNNNSAQEKKANDWASLTGQSWSSYDNLTGELSLGGTPAIQTAGAIYSTPSPTNKGFTYQSTELNIELSEYNEIILSIDSVQSASTQGSRIKFLIQLDDGNWYVSNTELKPINNSSWTIPEGVTPSLSLTFSTAKDDWSLFTLNQDDPDTEEVNEAGVVITSLSVDLSGAKITGAGWYSYANNSQITTRFDNFQISASPIPEPASTAILLGGIVLLGVALARRTSR